MTEDKHRALLELLINVSREVATALDFARFYSGCYLPISNTWAVSAAVLW